MSELQLPPMSLRIVYFDHARRDEPQPGFRSGEAGRVWWSSEGSFETDTRVVLGPNSVHALLHHGVVEALTALGSELAPLGSGSDALLRPAVLERAARILYEADRRTYGARYEALALREPGPPATEYRIAIDNREYQSTLGALQYLVTQAARHGHGVRIRI